MLCTKFTNESCHWQCIVRRVARRFGLRPVGDDEEWTVYWTDTSVLLERVMEMKRYQVDALPQDNREKYEQLIIIF